MTPASPAVSLRRKSLLWSVVTALCTAGLHGSEPELAKTMEKAASDWIKARKEIAHLETEWSTQRPLLESLASRLTEQAQELADKRDFVLAKTAAERAELARLLDAGKLAAAELQASEGPLRSLSDELLQLRPALPPSLARALELPYRSLSAPDLPLTERMQYTMAVLNRCLQFNRTITCQKEILTLDGGSPRLFEVIYWGLSHGYALDRAAKKAWYGVPDRGIWRWESLPDAARPVARLITAYNAKDDPGFVEVPARLKSPSADPTRN